ncbi:MAG: hypothetical protein ACLFP4_12925 [Spirochaetales bacterium]
MGVKKQFVRVIIVAAAVAVFAPAGLAAVEGETPPSYKDLNEIAPWERYPRALGAAWAQITGSGLHYHRWNGDNGLHLAAGIIYLPPEQAWETTLDYNVGAAYQRRLFGDVYSSWLSGALYLFAGGHHRGFVPILYSESAAASAPPPAGLFIVTKECSISTSATR